MTSRVASLSLTIFLVFLLGSHAWLGATEPFTARSFADAQGKLDQRRAAFYIVHRDKEPLSKFLAPGEMTLNGDKVVAVMADKLDDLRSKTGHEAPWTWQELDTAYQPKQDKQESSTGLGQWRKFSGFTEQLKLGKDGSDGSVGPIRLRKSATDLTKPLKDAKGASVGVSYNHLVGGGPAWNSEGVLDYPIKLNHQGTSGQSAEWEIGPAAGWKLAQVQGASSKNVEELDFAIPMTLYFSPGRPKMTGTYEQNMTLAGEKIFSRLWLFQAKPYLQTDFSFDYKIVGAQASAEFVGGFLGTNLYLGGFQNIPGSSVQYQLRLIPKIDYSDTLRAGIHTTRKTSDDWLRLGGIVSLDFRLGGENFNPLDFGVSYEALDAVNGSGGYSGLVKAHITSWLTENCGLTLEYSKGDTPVADKPIDLVTLGLEVKY